MKQIVMGIVMGIVMETLIVLILVKQIMLSMSLPMTRCDMFLYIEATTVVIVFTGGCNV